MTQMYHVSQDTMKHVKKLIAPVHVDFTAELEKNLSAGYSVSSNSCVCKRFKAPFLFVFEIYLGTLIN
jgi:hypothetical protein